MSQSPSNNAFGLTSLFFKTPHRAQTVRSSVAFTLVEILIVVTIFAIFTGGVTVSLLGRQDSCALELAAKDIIAAIRFSCKQSKLHGAAHRIMFDAGLESYRIEAAGISGDWDRQIKGQGGRTKHLTHRIRIVSVSMNGRNIELAKSPGIIEFYPDGSGFHGRIRLENRKAQSVSIRVMPGTGDVYVLE